MWYFRVYVLTLVTHLLFPYAPLFAHVTLVGGVAFFLQLFTGRGQADYVTKKGHSLNVNKTVTSSHHVDWSTTDPPLIHTDPPLIHRWSTAAWCCILVVKLVRESEVSLCSIYHTMFNIIFCIFVLILISLSNMSPELWEVCPKVWGMLPRYSDDVARIWELRPQKVCTNAKQPVVFIELPERQSISGHLSLD